MRVAHILRKYNPAEWGGTESALLRLLDGLAEHAVQGIAFYPRRPNRPAHDPFLDSGHCLKEYKAILPVCGLAEKQRRQLISIGGNLLSFDLIRQLATEPGLSVIHTHTLNRLGGAALTVARWRRFPLVVTIHGGVLDLPEAVRRQLAEPLRGGWEWGKLFGALLQSRRVLEKADAVITCNRKEAELVRSKFSRQRVLVQPHGVAASRYEPDCKPAATAAFPVLEHRTVLLSVGRIDPVKNQVWLVRQLPILLAKSPNALLVLAGACTDEAYGKQLKKEIRRLGLENHVLLTGGLPAADARLIGLFQLAAAVALPSLSETFGLVILEAWAAGAPVLSSRTSGATDLLRNREDGWLFDLTKPETFHRAIRAILENPAQTQEVIARAKRRVRTEFDATVLARQVKELYLELIEEKAR